MAFFTFSPVFSETNHKNTLDKAESGPGSIFPAVKRRRTTSGASTSSIESATQPNKKQVKVSTSSTHIAIATLDGYIKVYSWDSFDKPLFQERFN